ncbi:MULTISPECIES: sugar O-acetyltransferase [unclassified Staphylococcus]|uniref:sugar O-acetyltransferase n=1 Tax=unclassified Staphylococcus TaxID=91994 RepID=UPI0023EE834B|nr:MULTISPECIES: sugar O-acetyltransferase [unclassified Staphylococcus]
MIDYLWDDTFIGTPIHTDNPLFTKIHEVVDANAPHVMALNTQQHTQEEKRQLLEEITGHPLDPTVQVNLPFNTDFGKHISIGKHVFINSNVMFTDLGGITLEDHVLIGPRANLITVNHDIDPQTRRSLTVKPISIKRNAWIGAAATILPGITIGENAVVGANALVTKDVPPNTIVGGNPARILKTIEPS